MPDENESGFCGECGTKNPLKNRYCFKCGQKLDWPAQNVNSVKLTPPIPRQENTPTPVITTEQTAKRNKLWFFIILTGLLFLAIYAGIPQNEPAENQSQPPQDVYGTRVKNEAVAARKREEQQRIEQQKIVEEGKRIKERFERIIVKELSNYPKGGTNWRNILIRKDVSREDIIWLAREMHDSDPDSYFRFIDDDSKFEAFKMWDIYYPSSSYPYPEDWAGNHIVATLNELFSPNGMEWTLTYGLGEEVIAKF